MRSRSTGGGEAEESGGGEQDHGGENADQEQPLSFVDRLISCFEYHQGCDSGMDANQWLFLFLFCRCL